MKKSIYKKNKLYTFFIISASALLFSVIIIVGLHFVRQTALSAVNSLGISAAEDAKNALISAELTEAQLTDIGRLEENISVLKQLAVSSINRSVFAITAIMVVTLLVFLSIIMFISDRLARGIIIPIQKLTVDAALIGGGDLEHTLDIKTGDELELLADAFNAMIANIKKTISEKEHIERVNAQKTREAEIIMEAHQNMQTILEMMPAGVVIFSLEDWSTLYRNRAELKVLGYSEGKDEETRQSIFNFLPEIQPDGRKTIDIINEHIPKGSGCTEMQCVKTNGEPFIANISFSVINFKGTRSILVIIEDITAEKEYEQMLRNTALREQEANQLKSRFLAMMSHEIRTPMNAILGIAEIQLQDKKFALDPEEAFRKIYEAGDLLLNIINDVLDLSKIEAGKMAINPIQYDMPNMLNDTVQLNLLRYESKPIQFNLEVDKETPLELYGDELRIKQILNNIISNAFKYTESGKVRLSVSSQAGRRDDEVTVVFRVSDTGRGMAKEQIDMLFNEFTRFGAEAGRAIVGTGLGLNITKRLVELMDGEISVESKPGAGSVFTVRIPQKRAGRQVCGTELSEKLRNFRFHSSSIKKKPHIFREYMPYGKVLVVDDVESNLYVNRGLLLPYGLDVETVSGGFEAIEKIKTGKEYDIIFMDHMMPELNGIDAAKIIRGMGYSKPIVALTANAIVGQADMFLKNGFDGYITKPIDSRELNAALIEFIRNRKQPGAVMEERAAAPPQRERTPETETFEKYFVSDAEKAIKLLKELYTGINTIKGEDLKDYITAVHGMKAPLANLGEQELCNMAKKLEKAGIEEDYSVMAEETPAFIGALRSLAEKCAAAATGERKSPGEEPFLREKLLEVKQACVGFDTNAARSALEELLRLQWNAGTENALNEISVCLLHSNFKKTASLIADILEGKTA